MEEAVERYCLPAVAEIIRTKGASLNDEQWGKVCLMGIGMTERIMRIHKKPTLRIIGRAFSGVLFFFNRFLLTFLKTEAERVQIIEQAREAISHSIILLIDRYRGGIDREFTETREGRTLNLLSTAVLMKYPIVCEYLITRRNANVNHIIKGTGPLYYCCQYAYQQAWLGNFQRAVPDHVPAMMILFRSIENKEFLVNKRNEGYDFSSLRDPEGSNIAFYASEWSSDENFAFIRDVCDIHHKNNKGETAVWNAIEMKNYAFANRLLDAGVLPAREITPQELLQSLFN